MKTFNYDQLIDRQALFIEALEPSLRNRILKTHLFIAGCGLGGNIALLAARTGFSSFTLADYDSVDITNLNRQPYYLNDVGKNKAEVLAKQIKGINPQSTTIIVKKKLIIGNIDKYINNSDIIVNTIDLGNTFYVLCNLGQDKHKHVLLPMNLGYGAMLFVINSKCVPVSEIAPKCNNEIDFLNKLINTNQIPEYLQKVAKYANEIKKSGRNPQMGIASNVCSSITVATILSIISGNNVPTFPKSIWFDSLDLLRR